jgi:adenylate cyclase
VIDKFIGDGILAYFGFTSPKEEHGEPSVAIEAALEFRSSFADLKQYFHNLWNKSYGIDASYINLKCGMDNGLTFLHYFNTPTRNSLILMGPTVNLASRLEDMARENEIIVSQYVKNMVKEKFEFSEIPVREREEKGIKGFPEEDFVYAI